MYYVKLNEKKKYESTVKTYKKKIKKYAPRFNNIRYYCTRECSDVVKCLYFIINIYKYMPLVNV